MFDDLYTRLEYQLMGRVDLSAIPGFITDHTYIKGGQYSFIDHEFQLKVISSAAREVNSQKCSQIGMTEAQSRWGLAAIATIPDFNIIYTFPFSQDAENFAKTRVDLVVDQSPRLARLKDGNLWNSSIKRLGTGTIYFKGTNSETAAISTPADCIISDEIDRSNQDVLDQYESRLTHSKWQLRRNFSTPTVAGRGIDACMQRSVRYKQFTKCTSCNERYYPDFFKHVVLPGWSKELWELDKYTLPNTHYMRAYVACPRCGTRADLSPKNREWVAENPAARFSAEGFYISPFDAPNLISIQQLLEKSVKYRRYSEFKNQNLGLTAEEASDTITQDDLEAAYTTDQLDGGYNVFASDMGLTCNAVIGRMVGNDLLVVHKERIPLQNYERRRKELCSKYRCIVKNMDMLPYTDTAFRMQAEDPDAYCSVYVRGQQQDLYTFGGKEEDEPDTLRALKVNRNMVFDEILALFKARRIKIARDDETPIFTEQLQDMKKAPEINNLGETVYVWKKSEVGNDHYHHALAYLYLGTKLPCSPVVNMMNMLVPTTFKVKH
jgi:hypothetical protein